MGQFKFEVWPTEHRHITQHFGANRRNYAQFGLPGHDGIDIRAPHGSKVFCVAPGQVFRIHDRPSGHNYGIHVRVAHRDGYKTVYAHLEKVTVKVGQTVQAGDVLGLADSTGNSFGAHLHLTLKKEGAKVDGWPYNIIDPSPFLLPLLGWRKPAGPYIDGWVQRAGLLVRGELGQVSAGGATLYVASDEKHGLPAGTIVIVLEQSAPFARVRVARAAIGLTEEPPEPGTQPPPIVVTVDGWAWKYFVRTRGERAVVGPHGVNLRREPTPAGANIGLVKAGSTVTVLGGEKDRYLPVRAGRNDFEGPVILPEPPPKPDDIPPQDGYMGWVLAQYLSDLAKGQGLTSRLGVNLRDRPDAAGHNIGLVKAFATVTLVGRPQGGYRFVLARRQDVMNVVDPLPDIALPDPDDSADRPAPPADKVPDTTPGWCLSATLKGRSKQVQVAGPGSALRAAPRRDARVLGLLPPQTEVTVTGPAQGEYTPVRVITDRLQALADGDPEPDPDPPPLGQTLIGLHASADPAISAAELEEFSQLRPGVIKLLSFHEPAAVAELARAHPEAVFIVRAFLSFGGRTISPEQFIVDTIGDMRRTLTSLKGRKVLVELHNEPNIVAEGLGSAWADGQAFNAWFLELLKKYRRALPDVPFLYPGLSPGSDVRGVKSDHIRFIEASRAAVEASDGLGVHAYWSQVSGMDQALAMVDDTGSRFRDQEMWITEASRNDGRLRPAQMAQEYLRFWQALQTRPLVRGVTYFVASASNPKFGHEVWVGKGIGRLVGMR
ncbi:MAG: peptidoglycan DD-metalloendopeptidase family protein [Candidatus Promineifilaceae bacterium]|nr:peptidoglycan DD-metalloendopeptidase family protein [Candidatus Promineifilaceae bacterium]